MGGYVYFIGAGDGFVKIGYSATPKVRHKALEIASPRALRVLAVFPGSRGDELAIHRALASDHVRGEWFRASAAVNTLIETGIDAYREPDAPTMPKIKKTKPKTIVRRTARRIAITFHVDRAELGAIASAARECGVKLDAFCGEAIAQWLEQYAMMKGAEPVAHSFSEVDARQATQPPPRDVLDIATAAHDPRIRAGIASDHVEPQTLAHTSRELDEPQDDEPPRVDSRANDPDDDDGATFPTRRPTGDGPRRIANRTEPEEDEDDGPRTVTPLAASLFRTPNPAGIKWKQGKDYGTRSQGHEWAAVRRPK